jgi:hypothetical protein
VRQKHEMTLNEKLQEWNSTKRRSIVKQLCIITGGGLSIGEFYNNLHSAITKSVFVIEQKYHVDVFLKKVIR